MKTFNILTLICLFILTTETFARSRVGEVVNCRGSNLELQSIYEARLRGEDVNLGPASLGVEEKIGLALDRLTEFSPLEKRNYLESYQQLNAHAGRARTVWDESQEPLYKVERICEMFWAIG